VSGAARRTGVGGFVLLALATALPALLIAVHDPRIPTATRTWAALLWVLCTLPAWARVLAEPPRRPFPFLPVVGFLFGGYYALPISSPVGVMVQGFVTLNPTRDYDRPVLLALAGWAALLAGYVVTGVVLGRSRRAAPPVPLDPVVLAGWGLCLLWGSVGVELARTTGRVPPVLGGFLNLFTSMGWFGGGLLVILALRGELAGWRRAATAAGIGLAMALQLAGGAAAGVIVWGMVLFLSVALVRGYPGHRWTAALVVLACCALLYRGVKGEYTRVAWYGAEQISPARKVAVAAALVSASVREHGAGKAVLLGLERSGRWGTIDVFADVVRSTPQRVPYWDGATYRSLVGALVPRVLWPGKPEKRLGNDFGHRYGYLTRDDLSTSVNFPFLVEFFANFAAAGVVLGMLAVGTLYQALERRINRPGQDPLVSILAVSVFVPLFNIESDFSLIFGGIIMAGAAQWAILRTIRFHARAPRPAVPAREAAP
jgi:hypothetical protein